MNAMDYFKSRGVEPSTTFFCEYCGLEKQNKEAHLITVAVCEDCYEADITSLHAQLAAVTAERDRLREALENLECDVLHKIDDWANAYPVDVFIEPTKEDWQKRNAVLRENGLSPDAFSGDIYRHCLSGMQKHIKKGMEIISALASEGK